MKDRDVLSLAEALVLGEDILDNQVLFRGGAEAERVAGRRVIESLSFNVAMLAAELRRVREELAAARSAA